MLNKVDFRAALLAQINSNLPALYQAYVAAHGTPADVLEDFPESNTPLSTPEFVPVESGQTMEQVNQCAGELEADAGYERLALAVEGVVIKIAIAAAVSGA